MSSFQTTSPLRSPDHDLNQYMNPHDEDSSLYEKEHRGDAYSNGGSFRSNSISQNGNAVA